MEANHRKTLRAVCLELRRLLEGDNDGRSRRPQGAELVGETACNWAIRLVCLRCMEARGLIDRVSDRKDHSGLCSVLANAFALCAEHAPSLFDQNSPGMALKPSAAVLGRCLALLCGHETAGGQEPAGDELFKDSGTLGWAYQYWNSQKKDRVFEKVRTEKGAKIEGADIIPATQLYTEPYMTRFLLQNSLGAVWMGMHPHSKLCETWNYYVPNAHLAPREKKPVTEITLLDPACGSGHFLLEAFDLFYDMYAEEGRLIGPDEICRAILQRNLHGIDIDRQSIRVAEVCLRMKAAERSGNPTDASTNLTATDVCLTNPTDHFERFLNRHPEHRHLRSALSDIFDGLAHADELGSLLKVDEFPDAESQVTARLKGYLAEEAVADLVDLLARRYDVVATNPPYVGKKYMGATVRSYLAGHYRRSKADTFAAFIDRAGELTAPGGFTALVTMKSWLYQAAFKRLRIDTLRRHSLTTFADLGSYAFDPDVGLHFGVSVILTCFQNTQPGPNHEICGVRVVDVPRPDAKAGEIRQAVSDPGHVRRYKFPQSQILEIPDVPFCYWLPEVILNAFAENKTLDGLVKQGLATTDNNRFLRFEWETPREPQSDVWLPCAKGGTYQKWAGLDYVRVNWAADGAAVKTLIPIKYPYLSGWQWVAKNADYYFQTGLTYSYMCYGSLSARAMQDAIFEVASIGVFPAAEDRDTVHAVLNARTTSWILRAISQKHMFQAGMTERLPLPEFGLQAKAALRRGVSFCTAMKQKLLAEDLREGVFDATGPDGNWRSLSELIRERLRTRYRTAAVLHAVEGWLERQVCEGYALDQRGRNQMAAETGTPAGWLPLIAGRDSWPTLDETPGASPVPEDVLRGTDRLTLTAQDEAELKERVRRHFVLGRGNSTTSKSDASADTALVGISMPTETFVEEIAQKTALHPVSVNHILREGVERDGWRSLPEERRVALDFTVTAVLTLLGHRWPRQITRGEVRSHWAAPDGVIPLTAGTGAATLLERVRDLAADAFADANAEEFERQFADATGWPLDRWLATGFFKYHARQFKRRPIAWQIQSRNYTARRPPAFACLIYYHKLDGNLLESIRRRYVAPLGERLEREPGVVNRQSLLGELRDFDAALQKIIAEGFASQDLAEIVRHEPLDASCSVDGVAAPPGGAAALLVQESRYAPDVNDGVRVNMAPLQQAHLLASNVLGPNDVAKAITARAHWRADTRRWCRDGILPQPAWWPRAD